MANLRGDLVWFVGYLDETRCCIAFTLNSRQREFSLVPIPSVPSCECLNSEACDDTADQGPIAFSSSLLNVGCQPTISAGSGDVYDGAVGCSRVSVKHDLMVSMTVQREPRKFTIDAITWASTLTLR